MPQIKRMIEAIRDNQHLEKLSLANMGLYDMDLQVPIEFKLGAQLSLII